MAARPIWRGHLRLALVTCPVALHSVYRPAGDVHFHLINPKTGDRVRMVTMDADTDKEVARRDLVKGYEFEKDRYVLLEEEDFERARIESSSTMTIDKFIDRESIDPVYFDNSYYIVPDGDAGQDVYAVLREAIGKANKAALSRVVISRRERAVAIFTLDKGLVLHTLHEPRDLYDHKPLFKDVGGEKPDPEMVKLAGQLVERQAAKFAPADFEDRYEARLRDVIAAKLKGEGIEPEEPKEPRGDNVIDLMAALKRSLGGASKPAAKAAGTPRRGKATATRKKSAPKRTATRKRA